MIIDKQLTRFQIFYNYVFSILELIHFIFLFLYIIRYGLTLLNTYIRYDCIQKQNYFSNKNVHLYIFTIFQLKCRPKLFSKVLTAKVGPFETK